jgi:hypothetical protein
MLKASFMLEVPPNHLPGWLEAYLCGLSRLTTRAMYWRDTFPLEIEMDAGSLAELVDPRQGLLLLSRGLNFALTVRRVRPDCTGITVEGIRDDDAEFAKAVISQLMMDPTVRNTRPDREGAPTARTIARAEYFKALKDAYPQWSQARVAAEASRRPVQQGGLGETVTGDTVRSAYRSMGWPWERGRRVH